jgi:hypothetical protein
MPFYHILDPERVNFEEPLTTTDIEHLAAYPQIKVLQCSSPVGEQTWELLNAGFFRNRPEVELRLFGFYFQSCDLSFAGSMSHVRRAAAHFGSLKKELRFAELLQAHGIQAGVPASFHYR